MRIAIVNDLPLAIHTLRSVLAQVPQHQVVWTAADGAEAVRRCAEERPDLVLMDLVMPVMDGVEATRRIMASTPCAILVVTATVAGSTARVFEALGAGALDAIDTPIFSVAQRNPSGRALLTKIEMVRKLIGAPLESPANAPVVSGLAERRWLFAFGSSAGGPTALLESLKGFPANTGAAFIAVSHLDEHLATGLATWLDGQLNLPVRLARDGDIPEPGVVLLPARDDHLVLTPKGELAYTKDPADYVYRPSIDALFNSIAAHWRGTAAGVLLTGMGRDGAQGLKKMRDAGFVTFAQDKDTCAVYGMPKAAVDLNAAARVLPPAQIGEALRKLLPT